MDTMRAWIATLERGLDREEQAAIYAVLHDAVPDFHGVAA
jgi:O-antigen biosynthesis protein WbqV